MTDEGKRSKPGRLALVKGLDGYRTLRVEELVKESDILEPVFRNGEILVKRSLTQIRTRAHAALLRAPEAVAA